MIWMTWQVFPSRPPFLTRLGLTLWQFTPDERGDVLRKITVVLCTLALRLPYQPSPILGPQLAFGLVKTFSSTAVLASRCYHCRVPGACVLRAALLHVGTWPSQRMHHSSLPKKKGRLRRCPGAQLPPFWVPAMASATQTHRALRLHTRSPAIGCKSLGIP